MNPIVIIGTGLAGYTVAREFRKRDKETPLHIITADDGASYSKPMLSNGLDQSRTPDTLVIADAQKMAADLNAEIWTHTRVNALVPSQHGVETDRGGITYQALVLALGADPIRIPLEGDASDEVLSVNDLDDYRRFRGAIDGARNVTIMGAGLIGCEFANDLRRGGIEADVVDPAPRPLGRLLPEQAAAGVRQALAATGIHFHFDAAVTRVDRDDGGYRVELSDGERLRADAVLSAIGLHPRTGLAEACGLRVERGIVVDRLLKTSADDVYALGDCAEVEGLVLPFVMPLMNAARALAATLAGAPAPVGYPAMPVVVKTPDCPIVVCPAPAGTPGEWREEPIDHGVRSLFYDRGGELRGFVLTGDAVGEKMALTKKIPPWLP